MDKLSAFEQPNTSSIDDTSTNLSDAGKMICSLQEFAARSTLFLPPYDQRLANDAVLGLHAAASQFRQQIYPRNSFKFKNRRSPPASLTMLISEMRKEVGSTSDRERLQGDTHEEVLDPKFCLVDSDGMTLVKSAGDINGADFVLSRLKNCTVWLCDICGSVRADRLENCKIFLGPVRSVLVEKIEGCTFYLASQQLRIHSAKVCMVWHSLKLKTTVNE
jgi:tubulin-specific chaperone C